jgi:NAD(P)-dependent dehydrogenase (short-subunit alcohol dehydrogenase family)
MLSALRAQKPVAGRIVVITGGARGIGLATATQLAGEGARVCVGDLDGDLAGSVAADIGGGTVGFPVDVTDHEGFTAALDGVESRVGPIDVLINNAGVMPLSSFEEESSEAAQLTFDVNVFGLMHGTRDAIRRMRPRGHGHIVNVASMAGVTVTPGAATYSASKHAVVGLCESLVWELRGTGIDLSYVLPALVNTELAAGVKRSLVANTVEPEQVAARIVGALRRPRLAVYVPGYMGPITRMSAITPRAVSDWFTVRLGADRLLTDSLGTPERARYAARVAGSAPGAARRRSARSPASEHAAESPTS